MRDKRTPKDVCGEATVNIAAYQMRLLVWRVVNKTLKFLLTCTSLGDDLGFQFNGHDKRKETFLFTWPLEES